MHSDLQFECAVPVANLTFEFGMLHYLNQRWSKDWGNRCGMVHLCFKESWVSLVSVRAQCVNVYSFIVSLFHVLHPILDDDTPKHGERKEKLQFWYGCCRPFLKIIEDGQPFLLYHTIFPQYSHNTLLSSIIPHVVPIRHGTHWVYPIVTMATKFWCWNCHHTNAPGSLRLTQEDNKDSCQQSNHQSDHQNDGDQDAELRWWKWDVWHRDGAVVKQ